MNQHSSIEREFRIEATPEVVYRVISSPEHVREWWPDEAELDPVPGGAGTITFGDPADPDAKIVSLLVVEADPPRRFSFRWVYDEGVTPGPGNSLLVTFDLEPNGSGTLLRFSETGFTDRGWEPGLVEDAHRDHATGWDHFLPRLVGYVSRLTPTP
ncbi:SRPBCC domain-containing protein [Microlunatus speluncae]|uniref:SRPBCC domain-containing protein n=1 Tax=Microlunatus speluncae TaxID=2594267 RepID=UPI00126634A6|nr:SRPBCC domain-containing protein [Microlunatus speluncae]